MTYHRAEVLVEQGQRRERLYHIDQGKCQAIKTVQKEDGTREELILGEMESNTTFGELSFVDKMPTSVTVRAHSEKVEVYIIEKHVLHALLDLRPRLGAQLYKYLSRLISK